jgi:hypothetical protein
VLMKNKIISWNVRDLNERDKRLRISNLLRLWKVDIVCLQETKMESISNGFVKSLWGCPYVDWCHMDSCGASGDILIMWDRRIVSRSDVCMGRFVVACLFRNVEDGLVWAFAGVYGLNRDQLCWRLWEELAGLISVWEVPWCIGGDFNVTLHFNERLGVLPIGLQFLILRILLRSKALWIFLWLVGSPLGPIVRRGPGWIVF